MKCLFKFTLKWGAFCCVTVTSIKNMFFTRFLVNLQMTTYHTTAGFTGVVMVVHTHRRHCLPSALKDFLGHHNNGL